MHEFSFSVVRFIFQGPTSSFKRQRFRQCIICRSVLLFGLSIHQTFSIQKPFPSFGLGKSAVHDPGMAFKLILLDMFWVPRP